MFVRLRLRPPKSGRPPSFPPRRSFAGSRASAPPSRSLPYSSRARGPPEVGVGELLRRALLDGARPVDREWPSRSVARPTFNTTDERIQLRRGRPAPLQFSTTGDPKSHYSQLMFSFRTAVHRTAAVKTRKSQFRP
ncbi:Hypothetical protein NTJ_04618 [Nesidiocoris tenuis]|uniref:Uncharacterized protein n=1 Tax=Nesidiocoris tenuis TaxID=355587 RepID=A0ABN7AHU9_9HEMI|nr:Hypothetical protein NTJ_04618 [Nesidiocoris tenuis]